MWNRLRVVLGCLTLLLLLGGGTGLAYAAQRPTTLPSLSTTNATTDGMFDAFAGTWIAHGALMRISRDGNAKFEERTYRWCGPNVSQPCDSITHNQITFGYHQQIALSGVAGSIAYGRIVAGNDPPGETNTAVTLMLGANNTLIYTNNGSITLLCGPNAPVGTCGA